MPRSSGAGDAFRAAFAVALSEGLPLARCLRLAAAAGAITVSRLGAEPSLPTREECERLLGWKQQGKECECRDTIAEDAVHSAAHMTSQQSQQRGADTEFPILFASRLNSMRERLDLWSGPDDVFGWVARQGMVRGLNLVDFNYPQVSASPAGGQEEPHVHFLGLHLAIVHTNAHIPDVYPPPRYRNTSVITLHLFPGCSAYQSPALSLCLHSTLRAWKCRWCLRLCRQPDCGRAPCASAFPPTRCGSGPSPTHQRGCGGGPWR